MEIPNELNKDDVLSVLVLPADGTVPYIKVVFYKNKVVLRYDGQDFEIPSRHICIMTAFMLQVHEQAHILHIVNHGDINPKNVADEEFRAMLRKLFGLE